MVLVLFILGILIFTSFIILILLLSTIKINIKCLEMENILLPKLKYNYDIQIGIYIFNKIPLIKFNINSNKVEETKIINKIQSKYSKAKVDLDMIKALKLLSIKIESLSLNLQLGTEDVLNTSIIVFIISSILSIGLPNLVEKRNFENVKYEIIPLYIGNNAFSIKLNSIICVKMVHIINIIYIYLQKRREEKNERASNRRSYANCNEQYTGYGRC